MKLLLDEHISPVVAVQLRRRGHDAEAVSPPPSARVEGRPLLSLQQGACPPRLLGRPATGEFGRAGGRSKTPPTHRIARLWAASRFSRYLGSSAGLRLHRPSPEDSASLPTGAGPVLGPATANTHRLGGPVQHSRLFAVGARGSVLAQACWVLAYGVDYETRGVIR